MNRDAAREEIKRSWKRLFPADRKHKGIICPLCGNGEGSSGDGITENPRKPGQLKCWKCGFQGDVIDLIRERDGSDYNTALQTAAADLGLIIDQYIHPTASAAEDFADLDEQAPQTTLKAPQSAANAAGSKTPAPQQQTAAGGAQDATAEPVADYTEYYARCLANIEDPAAVSYLRARGISAKTAHDYFLGYDPAWISPAAIKKLQAEGNSWRPAPTARIILPVTKNHYVARAIDPRITEYTKPNETGGGHIGFFNIAALQEHETVFIVEGAFDALSIIEAGAAAVALNSTANARKFVEQLEKEPVRAALILCLDNDGSGQKAMQTIKEGLDRLYIGYITANISGEYKDPNEALTGNRTAFVDAIRAAQQEAEAVRLPGLISYDEAVNIFETADDRHLELKSFPAFSKAAKIELHDLCVLAADTGAGKSSLALNFLNDLNDEYPIIYFNLEMGAIEVLRRLVAIHSGMEIDRIEGYKKDENTAAAVNITLKALTKRKPLQVVQGQYLLQNIQAIIERSIAGREEPTIVIIDHSLLMDIKGGSGGSGSRYERFTQISEGLRKMALKNNIIMFVLLQQNREGKKSEDERPKNSSLKESGSWENDSTQIVFLWYDPNAGKKKLLITKNRHGEGGEFALNYYAKTQTYRESGDNQQQGGGDAGPRKMTRREKQRQKLLAAFEKAYTNSLGEPTLRDLAEAADVTTSTIKTWIKEYGGCTINGVQISPAGLDTQVDYNGFIMLTPADDCPFEGGTENTGISGRPVTATF